MRRTLLVRSTLDRNGTLWIMRAVGMWRTLLMLRTLLIRWMRLLYLRMCRTLDELAIQRLLRLVHAMMAVVVGDVGLQVRR